MFFGKVFYAIFVMDKNNSLSYYASISSDAAIKDFESSENGLSHIEAEKRIKAFGKNVLAKEKKFNVILEFISNFKNPLVIILLFASGVSFGLGETINALIITIMIFLSVVLNFLQEYSASRAAEKLRERTATKATVIRLGEKQEVKITDLCLGDVIFLSSGDLVPADARIISCKDFFVNQSSLTGESFPIEKTSEKISKNLSITDLDNIVFSGSSVITGSSEALIVKVGKDTELGKIAQNIVISKTQSEFVKGVKDFSVLIMKITIFFVLFIFLVNAFFKHDFLQSLMFAVAVAVGLTPELLPMIMSVTMARGSMKMAKKGVIVKKLLAIPNFGSMDVLCTDKTGTLTEGKIELIKYVDFSGRDSEKVLTFAYLNSSFQTGIKNPMDDAVINFKKIGDQGYEKIDEIPFDFERKRMSVVVKKGDKRYIVTKGAPEEVFKACKFYENIGKLKQLDAESKEKIVKLYHDFSSDGFRVLAVAIKEVGEKRKTYNKEDEVNLELIGLIAFLDPAKKDVKEVLLELEKMGVEIKVITGDDELVAKKICGDVGLKVKGAILGHEIDSLTDDGLRILAENSTIFARFTPEEKDRVINVFKKSNHVVGFLGDGINDAPSLKVADVGISVDNAVDVARESADMIMTHKSLRVLKDGIIEGRKTFGNTMKYIMMAISSNFGNMFSVLGAVLFLPFLPMLPIQILLNNFLYDFSQITIPSDHVDADFINSPKRWNVKFIKHYMFVFGPISSFYDFLTFFVLFWIFKAPASLFQTGWFLESLATQTLVIYIIRTKRIPFFKSLPSKYLVMSTLIILTIGWLIPFTKIGLLFNFVKPSASILLTLAVIVVLYLISAEIGKHFFYKKYNF